MDGPSPRLLALLKGLSVGSTPAAQAGVLRLFTELQECYEAQERSAPPDFAGEQDEELKNACKQASILFVARVLFSQEKPEQQGNGGCPISKIVSAAGINLLDFFREVNVVVSRLSAYFEARGSSSKLFCQAAHLKENSEMVIVLGLLAKKFKDNFEQFLSHLDCYKQVALRLGWAAFLVLRVKLLGPFPDVVSCVELLPCVFAVLASHSPRLPDCLKHIARESSGDLLNCMSEMCKADASRVRARMPSVQAVLAEVLGSAVPEWRAALGSAASVASKGAAEAAGAYSAACDLVASPVLDGLVTDIDRMNRALAALENAYDDHFKCSGSELDEREFLSTDFTKFASPRFSPGPVHFATSGMRGGSTPLRAGILLGPGAHRTAPLSSNKAFHFATGGAPPGLHSPLPVMHLGAGPGQPATPVSELMGASAWLRGMTATLAAEPSPVLQRFLAAIPVQGLGVSAGAQLSATEQLSRRVRDLLTQVIPDEAASSVLSALPLLQPPLATERRAEATKLYLHSLEALLLAEEKASGAAGVAALLTSSKFHRGLVACAVEIVAACYRMVSCAFPKVLDALHIKAFDLAKMIQSFVRSIPTLPRELKRHMFLIEEKILESLAWEPGSSLYYHILNYRAEAGAEGGEKPAAMQDAAGGPAGSNSPRVGALHPGIPVEATGTAATGVGLVRDAAMGVAAGPAAPASVCPLSPKRARSSHLYSAMSPAKRARGVDGAACPSPMPLGPLPDSIGSSPSTPCIASTSAGPLFEFCRKVLKLVAYRLALLCEKFDFSPLGRAEVNCKVYETIEHAMYHHTHMFYNRHADQIMLSALYGYCKVHKLGQVSFREIIAQYRKQPHAQQATFRSVVIEQSNPGLQISARADIICFYNQVFVPAMKSFLLKGLPSAGNGSEPEAAGTDTKPAVAGPASSVEALGPTPPGTSVTNRRTGAPSVSPGFGPVSRSPDSCQPPASAMTLHSPEGGKATGHRQAPFVERRIPDGLAALLQALDSQQGADLSDAGQDSSKQLSAPSAPWNGSMGEGMAQVSGGDNPSTSDDAAEGSHNLDGGNSAEPGLSGIVDDNGAGTAKHTKQSNTAGNGRRQRTPNRRYGTG